MQHSIRSLALAAVLLPFPFATDGQAQTVGRAPEVLHARGPMVHVHWDADTGIQRVLEGPRALGRLGASSQEVGLAFDNTFDPEGFADVLVHPAGEEIYDWGLLQSSGSRRIQTLRLAYSSRALPVSSGGPGGAFTFRLFERGQGFGTRGKQLLELNFTGLFSIASPFPAPVALTVDLGSHGVELPNGPVGWSFENQDGDTGPVLVDVTIANGTQNYYDVYDRTPGGPVYRRTAQLAPGPNSYDPLENTFWFQMWEQTDASVGGRR